MARRKQRSGAEETKFRLGRRQEAGEMRAGIVETEQVVRS